MELVPAQSRPHKKGRHIESKKRRLTANDTQIINSLNQVKRDLDFAHKSFELTNDTTLVDSFIFEILSLNKKYDYYIRLCKEKGLIGGGF